MYYLINSIISLGNNNLASFWSSPNKAFSNNCIFPSSTLDASITKDAVGLNPSTGTGTVESSQLNVIASGLSFIVEYDFSEGATVHPIY